MRQVDMVVEVTTDLEAEELHYKDRDKHGECACDGSYLVVIAGEDETLEGADMDEATLEFFHSMVPIASPEDFRILTRRASAADLETPGMFRRTIRGVLSDTPPAPGR